MQFSPQFSSYSYTPAPNPEGLHRIVARHPDSDSDYGGWNNYAGHLEWHADDGEISNAMTHADFQRQGIATHMLSMARQIDPRVHHSEYLSDAGSGWAAATGGDNALAS